jgi:membrane protein DedA with SNARE-associated domain
MENAWIEQYGYWAILIGAMLEGETVLVAAGYALSGGYLRPLPTFLCAVLGGMLGDVTYYLLGRRFGTALIGRFRLLRRLRARAVLLLRRFGAARFPVPLFLFYNGLGALAFGAVYLTLGYLFGEAIEEVLLRTRASEPWILLGIAALGLILWSLREWGLFRRADDAEEEPPA